MNTVPLQTIYYTPATPNYCSSERGSSKTGSYHTILYKHYILIFNASMLLSSSILTYNIETQQWLAFSPRNESFLADDLSWKICHFEQNKMIRFGLRKQREDTYSDYAYCEILVLTEVQNPGQYLQAEWQEVKINSPALKFATLNYAQNKVYVHGGRDSRSRHTSDLYIMGIMQKNNQYMITDHIQVPARDREFKLMKPRCAHSSEICRENIYFYGGIDEHYKPLHDMWSFNMQSLEWNEVKYTGLMSAPRALCLVRCANDILFIFGGEFSKNWPNDHKLDDEATLVTFDLKTGTWKSPDIPITPPGQEPIFEIYKNTLIYGKPYDLAFDHSILGASIHEKDENSLRGCDQKLFREKTFTDVTFNVEGQKITAHRAILATRCQHFNQIFLDKKDDTVIDIPEIKISIFNGLLEYIYCGDVEYLNEDRASELLKLDDKYGVSGLKEFCEGFLIRKLAIENIVNITNLADAYVAENLQKACLSFITENFSEVFKHQDIKKLSSSILFRLFQKKLVK